MEAVELMKIPNNIEREATKVVLFLNQILDIVFMTGIVMLLLIAAYTMWDSHMVYTNASPEKYEVYRPTADNTVSFEELQKCNEDVFGWITIYGTNIDYPVVQGVDNHEYLNKGPMKDYSLSGSIFEDFRHRKDLSSFNNLFYGHHMAEGMMFGDIDRFESEAFFNSHRYGCIYFNGQTKGLEIFAFLHGDAADESLFAPPLVSETSRKNYLEIIQKHSVHSLDIEVSTSDRLVVLTTCAMGERTDRNLLVAKITDEVHEDSYPKKQDIKSDKHKLLNFDGNREFLQVRYSIWIFSLILFILLIISMYIRYTYNQSIKRGKEDGNTKYNGG